MELKIKSYRGFIIKIFVPLIIIVTIFLILVVISVCITSMDRTERIYVIIEFVVLDLLFSTCVLIAKFYKGKNYIFSAEKIKAYKREKLINEINVNEIETIIYHPFRFRYVITIFFGELMDGGAWKLHVKFKDGGKISLSCFSKKDVEQLKVLYGGLIQVI